MNNNTVYKYTNKSNGKVYVGRTNQTVKQRAGKDGNGYNTCRRFWNAIRKYGWNNFELTILAENVSFEESVEIEKHYIELYKSYDDKYGYNIMKQEPGEGCHSEETIQKIREAKNEITKGIRKKHEKRTTPYVRTPEHCKHLSESLMGNIPWNKGKKTGPLKQETKEKMSAIRINNTNSIHIGVRNVNTGETFRSGAEAGRSIGCTSEAIFAAIKESRLCKGYMFERICE